MYFRQTYSREKVWKLAACFFFSIDAISGCLLVLANVFFVYRRK